MGVKRLGETRDVANLVQFLLSNEASYITGENILVAGRPISRLWIKNNDNYKNQSHSITYPLEFLIW